MALFNKQDDAGFTTDDERFLAIVGTQTGQIIENAQLYQREEQLRLLEKELQLAREIQIGYLPKEDIVADRLEIRGFSNPARDVGGDFYDIFWINDHQLFFSLGDVAGKGLAASLLASGCQAVIRTLAKTSLVGSLDMLARALNSHFVEASDPGQYITLFLATYDLDTRCLTYLNAGHVPPFIMDNESKCTRLFEGCAIVGAFVGLTFESASLQLSPDQVLFVCSDGVTENTDPSGKHFGDQALTEFLELHCTSRLDAIRSDLVATLKNFRQNGPQSDDITFLLMRVK